MATPTTLIDQGTDHQLPKNKYEDVIEALPKHRNWNGRMLCRYNDFWFPVGFIQGVLYSQNNFKAHDTDIILASIPKAGTTWLKALTFSIVNRHKYSSQLNQSPLLVSNPHELVPFLEVNVYRDHLNQDLESICIPSPRIFATHVSYRMLPSSIPGSGCKIIYICRNPLDQFVSLHQFLLKNPFQPDDEDPLSTLEEAFELYCEGIHSFGPFWDHILEYYNASLEDPGRFLFLKYEELCEDIVSSLEKLAEFIGVPFSKEERELGVVEEIASICSFEHLKNLNVNVKKGNKQFGIAENSSFFRKGEVGDWKNHLTGSMAKKVDRILEEKLGGTGLKLYTLNLN